MPGQVLLFCFVYHNYFVCTYVCSSVSATSHTHFEGYHDLYSMHTRGFFLEIIARSLMLFTTGYSKKVRKNGVSYLCLRRDSSTFYINSGRDSLKIRKITATHYKIPGQTEVLPLCRRRLFSVLSDVIPKNLVEQI